jgi:cytoskeletal protein RodZ
LQKTTHSSPCGIIEMSLDQIGAKLRATREGQSLSLGQVYDRTKIPPNHLEAIESGIADDLPEQVYVAGFIKRYADMLGLNGQSLADEYKRGSQPAESGRGIFAGARGAVQQMSAAPVVYVSKARSSDAPGFAKTFFYPSLLLIAVIGVVCGLAAWYQSQLVAQQDPGVLALNQSASRFNNLAGGQIPQTVATAPNALAAAGTATAPATAPTAATPVDSKISLSASQHVWVEVKAVSTGNSVFNGYLEMGERRDFSDPQGLRVRAGNGGSLSVSFNGANETMGAAGHVAEKVYAQPQPAGATAVAGATPGTGTGTVLGANGAKPVTTVKKPWVRKGGAADGLASRSDRPHRLDDSGKRDIPGVSGGGSRGIDVPYRYNDGRLDND